MATVDLQFEAAVTTGLTPQFNFTSGTIIAYVNGVQYQDPFISGQQKTGTAANGQEEIVVQQGDRIVYSITNPESVTYVNMFQDQVMGELSQFSALTGLTFAGFGEMQYLYGDIAALSELTSLTTINFVHSYNVYGDTSGLANLVNLTELHLDGTGVTVTEGSFANLTALSFFTIASTDLSQTEMAYILNDMVASYDTANRAGTLWLNGNRTLTADAYLDVAYLRDAGWTVNVDSGVYVYDPLSLAAVDNVLGGSFVQLNDIDLSGVANWSPIAEYATPFTGTYDGGGFEVKNMVVNYPTTAYVGLFCTISGGTVKNLGVTNATVTGDRNSGALAGGAMEGSTLENCWSSGTITAYQNGGGLVGGFFSLTNNVVNNATDCHSSSNVTVTTGYCAGGLFGYMRWCNLNRCYATGGVQGVTSSGGLIGMYDGGTGVIQNCYATGNVNGTDRVGGFIGSYGATRDATSIIQNCYSIGAVSGGTNLGAFCGVFRDTIFGVVVGVSTIVDCYYNSEIAGQGDSSPAIGKTSAQMQARETYEGWDFNQTWLIDSALNDFYPILGRIVGGLGGTGGGLSGYGDGMNANTAYLLSGYQGGLSVKE